MEFSDFTIRLIILLIPGAIASLIVESITIHNKWTQFRFIVSSIILGGASFCVLQVLYWAFQLCRSCRNGFAFENLQTWDCFFKKESTIVPLEIFFCLIVSVVVGYLVSYLIQHKAIFKLAKRLNVSRKFGDDSLYYQYLNSADVDWVYVRDKTTGLTYMGQVESFSEDEKNKELLLRNVTVYSYENSDELYKLKQIYLKFNERDVVIELP